MRHILLFDGTWQSQKQNSNINTIKNLVKGVSNYQSVFYDKGVGTGSMLDSFLGIFGFGLGKNVQDGYKYLINNYNPGDSVFLFGFSRGAFTARSLAAMIDKVGLVSNTECTKDAYDLYRNKECLSPCSEITNFRNRHQPIDVDIEFIGVFDTVGSLGVPYIN